MNQNMESLEAVAVIGIACRFPGAWNCHEFWNNLALGIDSTGHSGLQPDCASTSAAHSDDAQKRGISPAIDHFDAEFFNIESHEAELLDPQQRIFLECAWEAMEDSGHDFTSFAGPVGVFAASDESVYTRWLFSCSEFRRGPDAGFMLKMNGAGQLANRVARHLNLRGPSLVVQAGSASSLVAISSACRSLLSYECDVAFAGGISVQIGDELITPDSPSSCDSREARPGNGPAGNTPASGGGVLVLRRYTDAVADRDLIRAVIRGAAVNTDGGLRPNPIQASVDAQAEVIALAQAVAGVSARDISYIESAGIGDPVNQSVEIPALMRVFQSHPCSEQPCALGSVKANTGYLGPAQGMASIIKTILTLQHQQIPPTLHCNGNQILEKAGKSFYIGTNLLPWPALDSLRYAGVSAFELGGTNAHLILEEARSRTAPRTSPPVYLLPLSAKSPLRCDSLRTQLAQQLESGSLDLQDVSYTLQVGRKHFPWRFTVACTDRDDAIRKLREGHQNDDMLRAEEVPRRPVFLFPGLGTHYPGMSLRLYDAEPAFARHIDQCCLFLKSELGIDLRDNILSSEHAKEITQASSQEVIDFRRMVSTAPDLPDELDSSELSQPALFVVEYALAWLFLHWGIKPSAMAGYSIGEYVAACLAGVFSLEHALRIVAKRSLLAKSLEPSSMLAVPLSEAEAIELAGGQVDLCGVHGPRLCVLGGTSQAIQALQSALEQKGIACRKLRSPRAFHTNLMRPIAPMLRSAMAEVDLRPPSIPYISNVTGEWIQAGQATSPEYWVEHLCSPVRFSQGVSTLSNAGHRLFLEIGPGKSLAGLVHAQLHSDGIHNGTCIATIPSVYETIDDQQSVIEALGNLWKNGASCDWEQFHDGQNPQRASFSISPMQRQRYWVDAPFDGLQSIAQQLKTASDNGRQTTPERVRELETIAVQPLTASHGSSAQSHSEIKHPPRTDTERVMAAIWSKKLDVRAVGAQDDFFQLGGDSLIAMQILAEVRQVMGIRIELQSFLRKPTVAALAAHADKHFSATRSSQFPSQVIAESHS